LSYTHHRGLVTWLSGDLVIWLSGDLVDLVIYFGALLVGDGTPDHQITKSTR
jgi:hypothetical protein